MWCKQGIGAESEEYCTVYSLFLWRALGKILQSSRVETLKQFPTFHSVTKIVNLSPRAMLGGVIFILKP